MNKPSFFKYLFFFVFCIIPFFCSYAQVSGFPEPQINAGIAKVYGKLNDPSSQISSLILEFSNLVTADRSYIDTKKEKDGSFYFEVPIECSTVIGAISSPGFGGVLIELSSEKPINVELRANSTGNLEIDSISGSKYLSNQDKINCAVALNRFLGYNNGNIELMCKMTPEEFVNNEMDLMQKRIDYAMKDYYFSEQGKTYALNELHLLYLWGWLLPYKERVESLCPDRNNVQVTDIHYYTFLKSFNLNNSQNLLCYYSYSNLMQRLLTVKAFNIPPISDTPIEKWLNNVKATLRDLVGFDTGQFYDLLVANAYAKQFNDEVTHLSDKQKDNIKEYFGDGEIAKILLRKNEEIIKMAARKSKVVVNETPKVSKEKLMTAIISKYKDKVVVVDFWATWCGPCLEAMQLIGTIKNQLKDKDIVFVYITNGSSPEKTWNKKILSIPGEHYYVSAKEWEYFKESFGFKGIPSYLIYDSNGNLKNQFTGYPGNEKMRVMIERLLP